jgi:hypothetical protein
MLQWQWLSRSNPKTQEEWNAISHDLRQAQPHARTLFASLGDPNTQSFLETARSCSVPPTHTHTARVHGGPIGHCFWSISGLNFYTALWLTPGRGLSVGHGV